MSQKQTCPLRGTEKEVGREIYAANLHGNDYDEMVEPDSYLMYLGVVRMWNTILLIN